MRKLKYGFFLNVPMAAYDYEWGFLPIGAHSAILHADEMNAKTLHKEFYYKEKNGTIHIVRNLTKKEAIFAKLTSPISKKIVGYVSDSIIDTSDKTYFEVKAKEKAKAKDTKEM